MKRSTTSLAIGAVALAAALAAQPSLAQNYPTPVQGDWIARDFVFHTGDVMAELRIHYTTIGDPTGEPVLLLHGTGGSAASFLNANFADLLFGAGQPLDAGEYYIIIPDAIGHGGTSKPSDGMGPLFPQYNYEDMVEAQYRLVTEGLGIEHLRLVTGTSQGGMHTWIWGVNHPEFMDALVPMASQPTPMSARNWMTRRMAIEMVVTDLAYNGGNYTTQPLSAKLSNVYFGIATAGGTLRLAATYPTADLADAEVTRRLGLPFTTDANDYVYQLRASRDYDPSAGLEGIEAWVLVVNSADDERNPPETGLTEQALTRIANASLYLIPNSAETYGHGTILRAAFWATQVRDFLESVPHRQ